MIDSKLMVPAEAARAALKPLGKTLKHRENTKLDYERYLSRTEHVRKKDHRSIKDEAALAAHETNLAQAQIDYQTADEQVKQTFPPVTDAVVNLMPYLLASQVMLQTTLVGQLYTILDTYTKKHRMSNPAPGDAEIVEAWDKEFTGFRRELEQSIVTIAQGKAVRLGMTLHEKDKSTVTGLGIRNKAGGLMHRKSSAPAAIPQSRPGIGSRQSDSGMSSGQGLLTYDGGASVQEGEEEQAPPKPPRPAKSPMMGDGLPISQSRYTHEQ